MAVDEPGRADQFLGSDGPFGAEPELIRIALQSGQFVSSYVARDLYVASLEGNLTAVMAELVELRRRIRALRDKCREQAAVPGSGLARAVGASAYTTIALDLEQLLTP